MSATAPTSAHGPECSCDPCADARFEAQIATDTAERIVRLLEWRARVHREMNRLGLYDELLVVARWVREGRWRSM